MRKSLVFLLLMVTGVSCRVPDPPESRLSPTGRDASFVVPQFPIVILSWTNQNMSNLVLSVRRSGVLSTVASNWTEVAQVSGVNSISLAVTSSPSFFAAVIAAETMTLSWDYPPEEVTPDLSFNLYWQPAVADPWELAANFPGDSLSGRYTAAVNSGRFALTATNSAQQLESDFSNIVAWTNSVGRSVPLQIRLP